MLTIHCNGTPQVVGQYLQRAIGAPTFDGDFKQIPEVRNLLRSEQRNRCAYCERVLPASDEDTKIEHFHPRSKGFQYVNCRTESSAPDCERARVEWRNLLLVCNGKIGTLETCDTKKSNTDICAALHNPKRLGLSLPTQVTCDYEGRISPVNGSAGAKDALENHLNLNAPMLRTARRTLWAELIRGVREAQGRGGKAKSALAQRLMQKGAQNAHGSVYFTLAQRLVPPGT